MTDADTAAIDRSHDSMSSSPPAAVTPFTSAITGTSSCRSRPNTRCSSSTNRGNATGSRWSATYRLRSPPALNARPSPVTRTARTRRSAAAASSASSSCWIIAPSIALSRRGLSSVMSAATAFPASGMSLRRIERLGSGIGALDLAEQHVLLDLPRGRHGNRVDDAELLGDLVRRQPGCPQPVPDRVEVERRLLVQPDAGAHALAQPVVRDPHHRRLPDLGEPRQQILDLARRDVDAAPDDDLLLPPDHAQVAVGVDRGQVPRPHPSVVERGGRPLRVVEEPHAGLRPPSEDLAGLAGRAGEALAVADLDLDARHREAVRGGALVDRRAGAVPRSDQHLGRAVQPEHADPDPLGV